MLHRIYSKVKNNNEIIVNLFVNCSSNNEGENDTNRQKRMKSMWNSFSYIILVTLRLCLRVGIV